MISLNVHRRHLTTAQRAAVAEAALAYFQEAARKRYAATVGRPPKSGATVRPSSVHTRARDEAAATAGISGKTLANYTRIKRESSELHEQVRFVRQDPFAAGGPSSVCGAPSHRPRSSLEPRPWTRFRLRSIRFARKS